MTIGQIKCFVKVVDEKSFAKAANALFVSQPAISKSIAKLEEELGFQLLDRKVGGVSMTPAGRMMYDFFSRSLDEYKTVLSEAKQRIQDSSEIIHLGCPDMWNPNMFYDKISEHFRSNFPELRLEIECYQPPDLLVRLQNGKLDFVLTHEFYPPMQYNCVIRHVTDSGCGVLYSKRHFGEIQSLADLKGADFLMFDVDIEKKFSTVVKNICSDYGFSPHIRNYDRFEAAEFVMACGQGVMFLTEWDNTIASTLFDYLALPYVSPVNLIYQSAPEKPIIQLCADELVKLFAKK